VIADADAVPSRVTDTGSEPLFTVKSAPAPKVFANVGFNGLFATAKAPVVTFCAIVVAAGVHDPFDFFTFSGVAETSFVSDPSEFL
jgi:hypothetical protein